ncbi:hypothetical protein B0F90DRAFT_1887472 [Multifurca ochricompacta]|uniref:Uncharacterized protein n=1 Tax=Multifurca ochricompacta TaxID=376703 RepID=A0AAD4LY42_9AGAM|nr:hypothetical protein B0F90DRAFT_1887472 [Multifurca ochricompacta]
MTSFAARATDSMNEAVTHVDVCKALLNYLDTDTVCFHQDYPDPLPKWRLLVKSSAGERLKTLMTLITMMYDGTLAIQPVYWLQSRRHTQIPLSTLASSSRYSGNVPSSNVQNAAVCAPACRARYHDDITGAQQNRDWRDVACEATNKKDSGIAEAVDGTLVNTRGDEKSEAYEIEASGEVAQSLEWSTWPIRVPASGSTSTKCRLSDTKQITDVARFKC